MIGGAIPLQYLVGVAGAEAATGKIRGLTTAMATSRGAFGRPLDTSGWLRPIAGVRSALSGLGRSVMGIAGGLGLGMGVAGFTKLVRESSDFDQALISLQGTLKLSDQEVSDLRKQMEDLAVATGRSRTELLASARTATDYGVSLQEATATMEDMDALARTMDVAPEALLKGYGGLRKLAGEDVSSQSLRTLMFEGHQASGMPEDRFLDLMSKIAPQLAGVKGLEGESGVAFAMAQIAALGETFSNEPRRLKSGIQTMIDAVRDPKNTETFKRLGIRTDDLALAQRDLLAAVIGQRKGYDKIEPELLEFLIRITQTEGALGRLETAQNDLSGDMSEQSAALQAQLDKVKDTPTWDKLMEWFKRPLLEAADSVFTWTIAHMPHIQAAFQTLGVMVSWAIEKLAAFGGALVTAWKWVKDNIGEPIAEELVGGSGIMRVASAAVDSYQYGTERQRENLADRDEMFTAGTMGEFLSSMIRVRETDNPAWVAPGATSTAAAPQVNVYVDSRVDQAATVRAEQGNTSTTVNVNGAPQ